jgi:hypothetical protein
MFDRADRTLAARLAAAEERIPVNGPPPRRDRGLGLLRAALIAGTVGIGVLVAAVFAGPLSQRVGNTGSPSPGAGVSAQAREGDFVLTLSSPRSAWAVGEPIDIKATLSYVGAEPEMTIWGGGGPVVFSLRQLSGGNAILGGGQDLPCIGYDVGPDSPLIWPFGKAGGVQEEPPFDLAWFQDPELTLPTGRWEVIASLSYSIGACDAPNQVLDVAIEIEVAQATPTAESSVSQEPSPSSAAPTPFPSDGQTGNGISRVASFGTNGNLDRVSAMTAWQEGLVAVGANYSVNRMPAFGPLPPHDGRIWTSSDGVEWRDATPPTSLDDVVVRFVVVAPDGALVAIGELWNADTTEVSNLAWRSADARTWQAVDLEGLPLNRYIHALTAGPRGMVAAVDNPGFEVELWHSNNATSWTRTRESGGAFPEQTFSLLDLKAGPEGFVALMARALHGATTTSTWHVVASSDGVSWIEAEAPEGSQRLAANGNDWVLVAESFQPEQLTYLAKIWSSANGLDWRAVSDFELPEGSAEVDCPAYPTALVSSPPILVLGTTRSGPCSEGGYLVPDAAWFARGSALEDWQRLAIGRDTAIVAVATHDNATVIAGNTGSESTRAEFWIIR